MRFDIVLLDTVFTCSIGIGRHRGMMMANEHIRIGSNSYEKLKTFKYLHSLLTNLNSVHEEIECRLEK